MTAHHKVSLLLANKAVWEEGLPFFHRLHEFELRIPERCETILTIPLPYQIQQVLRVVAKVRLVDQVEELYDALLDNVGYYVAFLKREFTELKSLKASITLFDCDDHPYAIKQIQQLWPRLNYLQLIVNYVWTGDVETILRSITPGLKWSLAEVHPWDYDSFWRIGVYLDRTHLEEGVTEIDDLGYELP